jgi:SAP domain
VRTIARVKYDVRGVEGARQLLPAGVYNAKVASADVTKPEGKDERIEVVLEIIGDKTHNGAKLFEYINLESEAARWKLREFLEATQTIKNGKEAGTLDTAKLVGTVIGVKTFVRPADDARGFDESARVRRMFVADGVKADAEPDEDLDDDDDDESDYDEMSLAELKAELKERDLSTKGKKPALVARLVEDDEAEEEDEDEDDSEEYSWDDISELSKSELKDLIDEEELEIPVKKKTDVDDLRLKVAEALEIEVPEDEEDDDDEDDYDEWDVDDLKTELEERSLSVKGSKKVLVSRLRKDDAEEDKPF